MSKGIGYLFDISIDADLLETYYQELPQLEFYRNYINESLRMKPHMLSAEMEKLLAMTSEMGHTASSAYSIFNNSDLTFPEMKDEEGDTVRITHGRFIGLLESSDRRVRKEAFEKLYHTYDQYKNTLASLYSGQIKKQIFHAKARNYNSTLEASVDENNVSPKVYGNLLETVNKNLDKLHRYVSLRKKYLGVDELHMYDLYCPLFPQDDSEIGRKNCRKIC